MLDNELPPRDHNLPPAFDASVVDHFGTKTEEFLNASQQWLAMDEIATDEHAGQITDQIDGLRGLYKKVDDARKEAKKPHDDAGKDVQAAFTPMLTKLKTAAEKLKPKLASFAAAKARAAEEERRQAEAEARRQADEAEAARKAAEQSGDIGAQVDAEEAAKAADKAQKDAARKVDTGVKSATGAGRTMSLRKIKEVEVTNINVLFMALRDEPEIQELLQRIATRVVRAKGYGDGSPLPGVTVTEREVMA